MSPLLSRFAYVCILMDPPTQLSVNVIIECSLCYFFFNILRKKWVINLIFCMQINIKVSYHLILTLLASKFLTRWYYQYWWAWSSILKVLKVTSFAISSQYLKKAVRDGFHFLHANKHQSFYKLVLSFLMEVARHVQSTQNRKLVMLFQYIKKKLSQLSLCSIVMNI